MELSADHALFVGFRLEGSLRHQLDAVQGPDRKYVSREDTTFLTIVRHGDELYVGKVVEDRLTTDRVDDVRRNVLSIVARLCPETRIPTVLEVWPCPRRSGTNVDTPVPNGR